MKKILKTTSAALLLALPLAPVAAQEAVSNAANAEPAITLQSDVMAIVTTTNAAGQATTKLVMPEEFTPGTKLSFGMIYANAGTQSATNVTGTSPINPASMLAAERPPKTETTVMMDLRFIYLSPGCPEPMKGVDRSGHLNTTELYCMAR